MVLDSVSFAISTTLAFIMSAFVAHHLVSRTDTFGFILGTLAGFTILTSSAVILTGFLGALSSRSISIAFVATSLLLLSRRQVHTTILHFWQDRWWTLTHWPAATTPVSIAVCASLFLSFVGVPTLRTILTGPGFGADDLSYHAPAIAEWVLKGRVVFAPYDYHAYYPFSAEAFGAWFVLPFRADGLAGVAGAFWILLLWTSAFSLAHRRENSLYRGALTGTIILAAPVASAMATRLSSPDVAGVGMILAALYFLRPPTQSKEGLSLGSAITAGAFLGFALGCKVSFGIVLAIAVFWVLVTRECSPSWSTRFRTAVLMLLAGLVVGGVWYIRNWIVTGNPLFPAQVGPFAGPFLSADQSKTKLATWILSNPTDLRQWSRIFLALSDWPITLFALASIGYVRIAFTFLRRSTRTGVSHHERLLMLVGIVTFLAFFFLPFSGTDNDVHGALDPKARFLILTFAIGIIFFSTIPVRSKRGELLWTSLVLLGILPAWTSNPWILLAVISVLIASVHVLRSKNLEWVNNVRLSVWGIPTVLALSLLLLLVRPIAQNFTDHRIWGEGTVDRPIGRAWEALDSLPAKSRIGWFTNKQQEHYPFYGRRYRLEIVPLDPSGTPLRLLHDIYLANPQEPLWWEESARFDSSEFLENIRKAKVDYLFVSKWDGEDWPPQHAALSASTACASVYSDGYTDIWHLRWDERPITR